jgi:hypothetical protein
LLVTSANVFAGSSEVVLGVAAGDFAVVGNMGVGIADASAGFNALGANAASQRY